MGGLALVKEVKTFGGWVRTYEHESTACACTMRFAVYLPPAAESGPVPAVYWLSGLTCTEENFMAKAGAQRYAAELGLALVAPDTSPRGDDVHDQPHAYDLGTGAGFYVDATESPWSDHYHMYSYVTRELPALLASELGLDPDEKSVCGHSMGGHGALVAALRNPGAYRCASVFAPICAPSRCPWGEKALGAYLGDDRSRWQAWDATCLVRGAGDVFPLLVDQGGADEFLDTQLRPDLLRAACEERDFPLELRMHAGYGHGYEFIATFIGEHLERHARALGR